MPPEEKQLYWDDSDIYLHSFDPVEAFIAQIAENTREKMRPWKPKQRETIDIPYEEVKEEPKLLG